jgi:hypothetical protein
VKLGALNPAHEQWRASPSSCFNWPNSGSTPKALGSRLAPDDVVNLQYLGLAGIYPHLRKHRHEALAKSLKPLPRVPDLADPEVAIRAEADVVLESVRRKFSDLLDSAYSLVVLLGRQRRRAKTDNDAHEKDLLGRVRATLSEGRAG